MRTFPNVITASRVAAALGLLLLAPFSPPWFVLYAWCGASDVADGALARRWRSSSMCGARLDSLADATLAAALALELLPSLAEQARLVLWIAGIALVRLASLAVCNGRFGTPSFLHTTANKATGAVLFASVALVPWCGLGTAAVAPCTVATFSAVEELVLMATTDTLDLNRRGLFRK